MHGTIARSGPPSGPPERDVEREEWERHEARRLRASRDCDYEHAFSTALHARGCWLRIDGEDRPVRAVEGYWVLDAMQQNLCDATRGERGRAPVGEEVALRSIAASLGGYRSEYLSEGGPGQMPTLFVWRAQPRSCQKVYIDPDVPAAEAAAD